MRSSDYRKLLVWQKSMDLVVEIYSLAKLLPTDERFALCDQMRRAATSIPLNIAEGQGRNSDKDYIKFLSVARGSLWELSTQIEICERLNYVSDNQTERIKTLMSEVSKMLNALAKSLSSNT